MRGERKGEEKRERRKGEESRKEEMRGKKGEEWRTGQRTEVGGEKHLRTSWVSRIFTSVLDFPDQVLREVLRAPECQQPSLEKPPLEELQASAVPGNLNND